MVLNYPDYRDKLMLDYYNLGLICILINVMYSLKSSNLNDSYLSETSCSWANN